MRVPSQLASRASQIEIPMTPMIDVVFQLIIFFLCTASFQIVEHPLPTSVTQAAGSEPSEPMPPPPPEADFGEIVVRLRLVGGSIQWTLNGVPLNSLDQLRQRLRQIGQVSRQMPVILHPDPAVPLGDVIDAYDAARLERFTVAFTASLPTETDAP